MEEKREINQETDVKEETAEQMQPEEPENGPGCGRKIQLPQITARRRLLRRIRRRIPRRRKMPQRTKADFFRKKEKRIRRMRKSRN